MKYLLLVGVGIRFEVFRESNDMRQRITGFARTAVLGRTGRGKKPDG